MITVMRSKSAIVLTAVIAVGCHRNDPRPADHDRVATALGDAAPVDSPPDAALARGGPDDPLAEKLRHCAVAVDGARTDLREVPDGIELTVTGSTDDEAVEIRRRAAHLVEFTAGQAKRAEHGGGDGGGFMRNCPVVTRATLVSSTEVPGGARLLVRPIGSLTVAELRAETRRRHAAFIAP